MTDLVVQLPARVDRHSQAAQRQHPVRSKVVEGVKPILPEDTGETITKQSAPAQCRRNADNSDHGARDERGFAAGPATFVNEVSRGHFEHRNRTRKSGEHQQAEESEGQQVTPGHLAQSDRDRNEDESGSGARLQTESKDDRKQHQRRQKSDERVQERDRDRGGDDVVIFFQITSIGHDRSHPQAQGKEGVPQGFENTRCRELVRVKPKDKIEALPEALERKRFDQKGDHHDEQQRHQDSRPAFESFRDATDHHGRGQEHEHRMPEQVQGGRSVDGAKHWLETLRGSTGDLSRNRKPGIVKRPSSNDAVVGKDDERRRHSQPAKPNPRAAAPGELAERSHRRLLSGSPNQDFSRHDRQADESDTREVHEDESAAAVDAGYIGELPDVAESDSRSGRG